MVEGRSEVPPAEPPAAASPAAGEAIDIGVPGVTVIQEIGRGGFGVVYRAHQTGFDREVAVKLITAPILDDATHRRFERERRALGAVAAHPNIVTVFDAGVTEAGRPYLIMDYMPHGALSDRLAAEGPLPWEETVSTGIVLAGALETAHRAGILHRDIKPENVLVSAFGEPHLADFGIARIASGTETRSGVISASIAHAAPEVLNGERPSPASDVYSLGSTLVALLSGRAPFVKDTDETLQPIIVRILTQPPPDLQQHGVPGAVAEVLTRALAKDPAQRFTSAEAFGDALTEAATAAGGRPPSMRLGAVAAPAPAHADGGDARSGLGTDQTRMHKRVTADPAVVPTGPPAVEGGRRSPADPVADEPTEPAEAPPDEPAAAATRDADHVAEQEPDDDAPRASRRVLVTAGIAATILLVLTGVGVAMRGGPSADPTPAPSAGTAGAPTARDVSITVAQGAVRELRSTQFGTDPDGDELAIEVASTSAAGGRLRVLPDGSVRYTAPDDYDGEDRFEFTLSDGISEVTGIVEVRVTTTAPANEAPDAADVTRTVDAAATVVIPIEELGTDPNGDDLTVELVDRGRGSAEVTATGIRYTAPTTGSSDSFTFRLSDGELDDTATVSITVRQPDTGGTSGGDTTSTTTTTTDGTTVTPNVRPTARIAASPTSGTAPLTVTFNGSSSTDSDGRIVSHAWDLGNGSATGASVTRSYDTAGSYRVTLTVTDDDGATHSATTTITVTAPEPTNRAPTAKSASATLGAGQSKTFAVADLGSDADGDALTLSAATSTSNGGRIEILSGGTSLRYTAPTGYAGSDSFSFTVSDGKASANGTVSITVQDANQRPTAGNDSATTDPHPGTVTVAVLCNDSDPDGDTLSIVSTSGGSYGAPSIVSGGSYCKGYAIRYTPYEGSSGVTDSFTYQISDGRGGTTTATVTVTIR